MSSRLLRLAVCTLTLLLLGAGPARAAAAMPGDGRAPCMPAAPGAECCWLAGPGSCRGGELADDTGLCNLTGGDRGRAADLACGSCRKLDADPPDPAVAPIAARAVPRPWRDGLRRWPEPSGIFLCGTRTYLLTARFRA